MESNRSRAEIVGFIGGALMVLGSFLAWASVSADLGIYGGAYSESVSGTSGGDGWITLIMGAGVIALGVASRTGFSGLGKWLPTGMMAAGAIGAIVALLNIFDIKGEIDPLLGAVVDVSVGIGLWGVLLGSIAGIVGGFLLRGSGSPAGQAAPEPPAPA